MGVLWFLFLIVGIIVNIMIAQSKRRSPLLWAFLAILLGLISTVILAVLPAVEETKTCHRCYKQIPVQATRCPYCQTDL